VGVVVKELLEVDRASPSWRESEAEAEDGVTTEPVVGVGAVDWVDDDWAVGTTVAAATSSLMACEGRRKEFEDTDELAPCLLSDSRRPPTADLEESA